MNRLLLSISLVVMATMSAMADLMISPTPSVSMADRGEKTAPPAKEKTVTDTLSNKGFIFSETTLASDSKSASRKVSSGWEAWVDYTTGTVDTNFATALKDLMNQLGDQCVDFPEHFKIQMRENTENSDLVQYKLCDIFNHVDIILDYDRSTMILSADKQDTGIAISSPYDGGYATYHFAMNPVRMFELSKKIYNSVYAGRYMFLILVTPDGYGYGIDSFFKFDNGGNYYVSVDKDTDTRYLFVSSDETSTSFNLTIPDGVVSYRLLVVDEQERAKYYNDFTQEINNLYLRNPENATLDYTTETSTTQTVTPDRVFSYYILIPLDSDGKAADYPTYIPLLWNQPLDGQWTVVGKGTMKDNLWAFGSDYYREDLPFLDYTNAPYVRFIGESPATREVTIEALSSNPSIYRIKNPFGPEHSYYEYLERLTAPEDDFYLVIDTSDPSRVVFRPTMTGFDVGSEGIPFMFRNRCDRTLEEFKPDQSLSFAYGKFADGKISFEFDAIDWSSAALWMGSLLEDIALEIELPGYEEFSMTPHDFSIGETQAVGNVSDISPNIAKIEYALFDFNKHKGELQRFPEILGKMITDRADGVKVYTAIPKDDHTAELTIPMSEFPYGVYSLVAVAIDAQGNPHTSYAFEYYRYNPTPLSMWESAGNSTIDGLFIQGWIFPYVPTFKADLRVSPDIPGIYCLYEPFKTEYDTLRNIYGDSFDAIFSYDASEERYFFINATNPEFIFISDTPEGLFMYSDTGIETGIKLNTYNSSYTLYNLGDQGKQYTDDRGQQVIDFSGAVGVDFIIEDNNYRNPCDPLIITIDYDPDTDLSRPINWENVATVTVEENLLSYCDGSSTIANHECQLTRHPENEGIYALIDPFAPQGPVNPSWSFDGGEHHIIINATDPDKVFFDGDSKWDNAYSFSTGYTHQQYGQVDMLYMVNAVKSGVLEISDPTPYYGTATIDGSVSSNIPSLFSLDKGIYPCNLTIGSVDFPEDNVFRVRLKETGVDTVYDDTVVEDAATTLWYNLQGVRVATPDLPGIYIRVCGNRADKVVVR